MSTASIAVRDEAAALLPLLHSNRSAAYISLGRFAEALADATKTIELRPDWSKAYNRLAVANVGLGRFDDAFLAIRKGLEIEPENVYIVSTLVHALELVFGEMTVSEMTVKLQRDAKLTGFFMEEDLFSKMKNLHGNPKSVQLYLSDKRIMREVGVLLNVKRPQQVYCTSESSKSPPVIDRQMEVGDLPRALLEKDAGNAAYKKKDLETAIMHYSHGLKLVNRVLYLDSRSTHMRKVTNIMEDTFNANEIRVAVGEKFQSYIAYANHLLQEKGSDEIIFKAVGDAISKAVNIVEQFKRQNLGLHQNTTIRSLDTIDRHAPREKGLAQLDKSRRVPMIIIRLSRKPLDISSPGYQPPFSTGQMNHKDSSRIGNSHAAKNRYGSRCWNNSPSSNRSFYARGQGAPGRKKDDIEERIKIVEPTSSCNDNSILDGVNDEVGRNDTDDECVILDTNPFEEKTTNNITSLSNKDRNKIQLTFSLQQCLDDDELSVIAQRGQIACRDYPHARHLCGVYPFGTTPHETYCSQCYCYVCDAPAPCKDWNGISDKHCNATESDYFWKMKRDDKKGTSSYKPIENQAKLEELYELHTTSETSSDEVGSEDNGIDDADDDDCVILETDPFNVEMIRTTNNHSINSAAHRYFQKNKPLEKELTDNVTLSMNTEDCHKLRTSKTKSHECIFIDDDDDDFGSIHGNCVVVEVKHSDKEIMNRIITLSRKLSLGSGIDDARKSGNEDDLSIIAERGQVACRDYPHSRHLCAQHLFNRTPHETYCCKCYCYVCEVKAHCKYWERTVEGHCHASEVDSKWKEMREANRSSCNDR